MIALLMVTVTSMLLAAIMGAIAWRMSTGERRRSDARVAALSAEIHDAGRVLSDPQDGLVRKEPPDRRMFAVVGGGALVVAAGISIAILTGGRSSHEPRDAKPADAGGVTATKPLELVALGHERVGDQLTVRGVVRNPPSGADMDKLTAVVLLFTPEGGLIASGRAAIGTPALRAGGESTFAVTLPGARDVGRYRVSFTRDDRVVPHLDRRHES